MEKDGIITAAVLAVLIFIRDWIKDVRDKKAAKKLSDILASEVSNKKSKHNIEFLEKINREVTHETKRIRDEYQAMRVYVMHFTNGIVTEAGLPLMKVTFKHEVLVDWQVQPITKHFQESPMPEMFSHSMTRVIRHGEYYLKTRDELNMHDANQIDYNNWLKAYKVNSCMWLPMKKNGNIVAILVCHWPASTDLDGSVIAKIKDINRLVEKIYADL